LEKKLARLQRQLSRKVKRSCHRAKMRRRIALLHEKIKNRRQDELNQISAKLANDKQVVTYFVEDLNVKGMTSNRRLAKAVLDKSWGSFLRLLEQKCEIRVKHVISIGRFEPSSKTCHKCGHKK
jgi:putative transposase